MSLQVLAEAAAQLNRAAGLKKPLPPLLFFTDPQRTPDPAAIARRLPAGSAVVLRLFGAADALEQAEHLRVLTQKHGLKLLIGADAELAAKVEADGVHLPERLVQEASRLRQAHPHWLITAAAHAEAALAAAQDVDAAVVSPVFPSLSPSAGAPLSVQRFSAMVHTAKIPVYALGGVTVETVGELEGSGAAGVAAVGGLAD
ncbi:thiamine phosphate synthase [Caulobacter segnis]|uniref:thiamine phosphate synthase n=1 Tax=Caulobacter segnis TaxID=88688 RepID=UPI00240FFD01|nr:thiamine phosphate synthase [Caulobacter segnis]MDG2521546.1 thiamine phosphate synthase [Caulobacter segnis]